MSGFLDIRPEVAAAVMAAQWGLGRAGGLPGGLVIAVPARSSAMSRAERRLERFLLEVYRRRGPEAILARTWSTGGTVLWGALLLGVTLLLYYL